MNSQDVGGGGSGGGGQGEGGGGGRQEGGQGGGGGVLLHYLLLAKEYNVTCICWSCLTPPPSSPPLPTSAVPAHPTFGTNPSVP